jgi:acetoin utilization deacetylase AcuC-like enzyme
VLIFASDAHRVHHPRLPFYDRGQLIDPPEIPERAERIRRALQAASFPDVDAGRAFGLDPVRRVHTDEYLTFLEHAHARWREATGLGADSEASAYARAIRDQPSDEPPHVIGQLGFYSHDNDAVLVGTWDAAVAAADLTLSAWEAVADGRARRAYALARPPGHHAAADSFAGYCFLNNAAIAAQAWADRGARVAIVDVDYHHGNGTQQLFYSRDDVLFVSLHADPSFEYPFFLGFAHERGWGAGEDCTKNFPLPAGTTWDAYGPALGDALTFVRKFSADAVVVSLGVDTALEDHDTFALTGDDYSRVGAALATLDVPMVVVQEGGYNLDVIGRNVVNVLQAIGD